MFSYVRPCCVPNCGDKDTMRIGIPRDSNIQKIWLERINNPKLDAVKKNRLINYKVCLKHFHPMCLDEKGHMKKFALPTLNLPNYNGESSVEECFCYPKSERATPATPKKLREALQMMGEKGEGVWSGSPPELQVTAPLRSYKGKSRRLFVDVEPQPSTSTSGVHHFEPQPSTSTASTLGVCEVPLKKVSTQSRKKTVYNATEKYLMKQLAATKRLVAKQKTQKRKLSLALKSLSKKPSMLNHLRHLNETSSQFFLSQIRNQNLAPRGRRFSNDDKIFALSIAKQSGKGYRYLSRTFSLPSRKTLQAFISKVPFCTGVNKHIFNHLKSTVGKMKVADKYCVLMFDEVALRPGLHYEPKSDFIEGFVDFGGAERRPAFADHALLFMVKGIRRKWKQPIGFCFTESSASSSDLVRLIKDMVRHVRRTGLRIVATICDQGTTNVAAVNSLLAQTRLHCLRNNIVNRYQGYLIDEEEVVHLYDPPHLLKGIRNGLLKYDLRFVQDGVTKVGSWSHLVDLYRIDQQMGQFSQFVKLTDEHVLPDRIRKMKVRHCSQVFSHAVSTAMKIRAETSRELNPSSPFYLNPNASNTADLFLFLDKLFDSVNGSSLKGTPGKPLRGAVTSKSCHASFWQSAIRIIKSMEFITPGSRSGKIPSLKNWEFTLHGFLYIWQKLQGKNFLYLLPRCFNQDPVENFFACIRAYGVTNTHPTCNAFSTSTKSLLINNLVSPHSAGANCEEDESEGLLDTLKSFIEGQQGDLTGSNALPEVRTPLCLVSFTAVEVQAEVDDFATPYVAGAVAKKLKKKNNCIECKKRCEAQIELAENMLIKSRRHQDVRFGLTYPSTAFSKVVKDVSNQIFRLLPENILRYNLKKYILSAIDISEMPVLFCDLHNDQIASFKNILVNICLFYYINKINKILNGNDLRSKDVDQLTKLAFLKYSKRVRRLRS